MELGAFSSQPGGEGYGGLERPSTRHSASRAFGGDAAQGWLILKNGSRVIGLFHGMFEKNMLTFNPGWDQDAQNLASFTDVRELQRQLKAKGVVRSPPKRTRRRRGRRASSSSIPTATRFWSTSTSEADPRPSLPLSRIERNAVRHAPVLRSGFAE